MDDIVINAKNLGKKYLIGHQRKESYHSLRDSIVQGTKNFWRNTKNVLQGKPVTAGDEIEEFWALRDVCFSIPRGQSLGIIGRNGAGKSTLLKILSRITSPSAGRVEINGRVASLLEVGTGFHPELSGRENIFLNGAILGMTRHEVKKKFDEIVEFAEVQKYLDTPVKRYSSGMYVRLAFSVAAHLDPDIFIVDEVLAVGDTIFQKKCIDKMLEATRQEKTVLFVSHNFSAIKAFCSKAMLLNQGQISYIGDVDEAINKFSSEGHLSGKEISLLEIQRSGFAHELIFEKITFEKNPIKFGSPIKYKVKLKSTGKRKSFPELEIAMAILDKNQTTVIHLSNKFIGKPLEHSNDSAEYSFEIENILKPGNYYMTLYLRSKETIQDWIKNIIKIQIDDENPYGFHDTRQLMGVILPEFQIKKFD
jgi:lipopolysaccharide transport system ATP-binding protein